MWALASHFFGYKSNPPHNDDNAVMPVAFSRLPWRTCCLPSLFIHEELWSGIRGLNPLPSAWQADALPNELIPHIKTPINICKILELNQLLLTCQANALPNELISLLGNLLWVSYKIGEYINLRRPYRTFSLHTFIDAVFGKGTNSYILAHLIGLEPMTYRLEGDCYYPSELKMYIM